jgi:hypothetical protein
MMHFLYHDRQFLNLEKEMRLLFFAGGNTPEQRTDTPETRVDRQPVENKDTPKVSDEAVDADAAKGVQKTVNETQKVQEQKQQQKEGVDKDLRELDTKNVPLTDVPASVPAQPDVDQAAPGVAEQFNQKINTFIQSLDAQKATGQMMPEGAAAFVEINAAFKASAPEFQAALLHEMNGRIQQLHPELSVRIDGKGDMEIIDMTQPQQKEMTAEERKAEAEKDLGTQEEFKKLADEVKDQKIADVMQKHGVSVTKTDDGGYDIAAPEAKQKGTIMLNKFMGVVQNLMIKLAPLFKKFKDLQDMLSGKKKEEAKDETKKKENEEENEKKAEDAEKDRVQKELGAGKKPDDIKKEADDRIVDADVKIKEGETKLTTKENEIKDKQSDLDVTKKSLDAENEPTAKEEIAKKFERLEKNMKKLIEDRDQIKKDMEAAVAVKSSAELTLKVLVELQHAKTVASAPEPEKEKQPTANEIQNRRLSIVNGQIQSFIRDGMKVEGSAYNGASFAMPDGMQVRYEIKGRQWQAKHLTEKEWSDASAVKIENTDVANKLKIFTTELDNLRKQEDEANKREQTA